MNVKNNVLVFAITLALILALSLVYPASSQTGHRAVDLMLVIDNSCSMFPRDKILPGCQTFGSDPDFLRITGADLFIARLGFANANETSYNLGAVSLGDEPQLVSPLQKLSDSRDVLARAIANPNPQSATKLIPALEMAYQELTTSVNRQPANLKAVVLLTDGVPWPPANQSESDIEQLLDSHPDIPVFVMLLQSGDKDFESYNLFWGQMQSKKSYVYVYRVLDANQIEKTYNAIVAKIQNTIPAEGQTVLPGQPYNFFVSEDVQRIIITVVHSLGDAESQVEIRDPNGNLVSPDELGISRFRGQDNPVEVISIAEPRLSDGLKNLTWQLTSNTEVNVFLDRQGAYRIQFVSPSISSTDFADSYLAVNRFPPNKDFELKFSLAYSDGTVKLKPQIIRGKVILPDGSENTLTNTGSMNPDQNGVYTVRFNPSNEYPAVKNQSGKFNIVIEAGSADEASAIPVPISLAKLIVEFGPGPSFSVFEPASLVCKENQASSFSATVAGLDTVVAGSTSIRVISADGDVELTQDSGTPNKFTGDLSQLCQNIVKQADCEQTVTDSFNVRLSSQLLDTGQQISFDTVVPVTVTGTTCPLGPTPTPTPAPPPNCDGDALVDAQDQCPCQSGLLAFQGCPPPLWVLIVAGILFIGLVLFIIWVIPSIRVLLSPPPQAFVLICIPGDRFSTPKSLYMIGMERRVNQIKIGGDPKQADIFVKGLQPVEYVVVKSENKVQVLNFDYKNKKTSLRLLVTDIPATIPTSLQGLSIKFSLKKDNLGC